MTERQIQAAMEAAGMKFQRVAKNGTLWSDGVSIVMVRAPGAWPYHVTRNFEGDLKRAMRKRESMQPAPSPIVTPNRAPQRKVIRAGKVATIGDMIAADAEVFKQAKPLASPAPKLMSDPKHRDDALVLALELHGRGSGWQAITAVLNGDGYRRADGRPLIANGLAKMAQLSGLYKSNAPKYGKRKEAFKPQASEFVEVDETEIQPASGTLILDPPTLHPVPEVLALPSPTPVESKEAILAVLRDPNFSDAKKVRIILAILTD